MSNPSRARGNTELAAKRMFDLVSSALALVVLSPLLLCLAAGVKLTSPGPVFYRGVRTGLHGRPFRILKFRTMIVNAAEMGGPSTGQDDPRVTRFGAVLRRFKLDELPNLVCVLVGQMSIVGPRPEVPRYTSLYTGDEKLILTMKPGITDLSSLQFIDLASHIGADNIDANFESRVLPIKNRLRVQYVREWSFWTDMKIIGRTLAKLFGNSR
ncbi:MAG: sugar transferase [Pseudomonadota bacterium]|nr:sugar transferase [Pseudomonadota bacterium]